MLYVACILLGIVAARWLYKPLAALLRGLLMLLGIFVAFRLTMAVVPLEVDWRGFWSGAAVGVIFILMGLGVVFYILGWNGRASATESEEIDRARQKASRDRKVA